MASDIIGLKMIVSSSLVTVRSVFLSLNSREMIVKFKLPIAEQNVEI